VKLCVAGKPPALMKLKFDDATKLTPVLTPANLGERHD
jgi:hypothetical protein